MKYRYILSSPLQYKQPKRIAVVTTNTQPIFKSNSVGNVRKKYSSNAYYDYVFYQYPFFDVLSVLESQHNYYVSIRDVNMCDGPGKERVHIIYAQFFTYGMFRKANRNFVRNQIHYTDE